MKGDPSERLLLLLYSTTESYTNRYLVLRLEYPTHPCINPLNQKISMQMDI